MIPDHKGARAVMVAGTMSNAGKSFVAAGLCRVFTEDGYRVAPFKAQNMALNSFVTEDGGEMGRSQVVQARACRKKPDVRMNPILLKPTTDKGSQVILLGHPVADMDAKEYYRHKKDYLPALRRAYESLALENDIIVLEGAGSPAEINLKDQDLVNMPMAQMADASVILVGNIDPGGVFAQLYGTIKLLEPNDQERIKGLIINKFRGDITILEPGLKMLEDLTGKKVIGVLPYADIRLEPEDSLAMEEDEGTFSASQQSVPAGVPVLDIAVIRLPKISNFTDFEALRRESDVRVRYVSSRRELGMPDAVILPGTKSTIRDLMWLRDHDLETGIREAVRKGAFLVGICGGYQMLGTRILDPDGAEMAGEIRGLGYLKMETVFSTEKILRQRERISSFGIPELDGKKISGYEVHMGRAVERGDFDTCGGPDLDGDHDTGGNPGTEEQTDILVRALNEERNRNVIGTYLHGLFDEEEFREAFLSYLWERKGMRRIIPDKEMKMTYNAYKEKQLENLAAFLRKHLDIPAIYRMMGL